MRVIYWNTSCLEPEIEAISKEVFQLARHFDPSLIFSINSHLLFRHSWKERFIGFHPNFDLLLRALIPMVARFGDIHHIYGELCPWIFFKTLHNVRPLLLTVASEKGTINQEFFNCCQKIIVQTETLREKLVDLGVEKTKVELIYPGVKCSQFRPVSDGPRITERPRVLFATAPRSQDEMEGRGVWLLLHAAKEAQDVDFTLLYRPWRTGYTSLNPTRNFIANHHIQNVVLDNAAVSDMSVLYRAHHFIVIPYTSSDGGKECPNSLIEALASGLPALISSACPFSYFVEAHQCGVVFEPSPSNFIKALEEGVRKLPLLSKNAAKVARKKFSQEIVLQKYETMYRKF
ncbi:MAG: hypothetical protein NPIRA03_09970 [Nitrospirales bacterium]|nr:MAG: hypothetical protein NPIRA03_09970 [Nitrospirales bacterium]